MARRTARERLVTLLGGVEPERAYATSLALPTDVVEVEVTGVGPLAWPINAARAKRLVEVARPAHFGHGTETLLDANVRDTWEVTPDQVILRGEAWEQRFAAALDQVKDGLGLPTGAELRAELHSMLIYGKGQFFAPHQDSEKHDEMVATLVVSLPSIHTGGDLVVEEAGKPRTFRADREEIGLVAFYADCRHEVKPVRSGWRVTLTFNLMLTVPEREPAGSVDQAAALIQEHFATRAVSSWGRERGLPNRLVFLLDHEYTQRSLLGDRFKGVDGDRIALLRAAAAAAECETTLAQADLHETWDVDGGDYDYYGSYGRSRGRRSAEPDDYELSSLVDWSTSLVWWTQGGGEDIGLGVEDHEACAMTETVALTPYESEYEGYMGNYGNTVDRWYRRAALVIWPAGRGFLARAEASPIAAMRELADRIDRGEIEQACADAAAVEPAWVRLGEDAALFGVTAQVAAGLRDAGLAAMLLKPFMLTAVRLDGIAALAQASRNYGPEWATEVVGSWAVGWPRGHLDDWVLSTLVDVCAGLRRDGADAVADALVAASWGWIRQSIQSVLDFQRERERRVRLAEVGAVLARVLLAVREPAARDILAELAAMPEPIVEATVPALRDSAWGRTPVADALAEQTLPRVIARADRPVRDPEDWSIEFSSRCGCSRCARLVTFLADGAQQRLDWAAVQQHRDHIESQLISTDLPIKQITIKQGRPYTLRLEKTVELFEREKVAVARALADVIWLRKNYAR